ncbi:MAG: hypothetical protein ABFC63_04380 [Thermoguttaceae bacterium]
MKRRKQKQETLAAGGELPGALSLQQNATPTMEDNLTASLLAIAATSLGLGIHDAEGRFSTMAIGCLTTTVIVIGLSIASIYAPRWFKSLPLIGPVLLICMCAQAAALIGGPINYCAVVEGASQRAFFAAIWLLPCLAVVLGSSLCSNRSWFGAWTFPILIVVQVALGLIIINWLRMPGIDVLAFQDTSCRAFLKGYNPYSIMFRDAYPPDISAKLYGPGLSVNGILQFGYLYMPLTLLMALPGYALGDVRYAGLACIAAAAVLIAYTRRGSVSKVAGALLAFSPIVPLFIYFAWTESYVIFLLALTVFCHYRKPKWMPYALGLLLVSKQYMLGLTPLALLLIPRPWTREKLLPVALKAAATGAIVTLPFVLWNPAAFWHSAVTLQMHQPFRLDALSFLVWAMPTHPENWLWIPFVLFLVMLGVSLIVGARRAMPFSMALVVTLLLFFASNKQAFANYYYLLIAALWCSVAIMGRGPAPDGNLPAERACGGP